MELAALVWTAGCWVWDRATGRIPNPVTVGALLILPWFGGWSWEGMLGMIVCAWISLSPGGDLKALAVIGGLLGGSWWAPVFVITVLLTEFRFHRGVVGPWMTEVYIATTLVVLTMRVTTLVATW